MQEFDNFMALFRFLNLVTLLIATRGEEQRNRDAKLLPPAFVAERYGVNVGDRMPIDTAGKIAKEAKELGERSPFFAAAGNDEVLMLPEVFSKLNPDEIQRDFAADGDSVDEKSLRDTRWWGRLYIDGWPQSIQYLRAHFGEAPPQGMKRILVADPQDACFPLKNSKEADGAIVIAMRGNCTFGSKGVRANEAGASALVLVNNEDGNHHIPAPDAHDLPMSVSMVARQDGELVLRSLQRGQHLTGALIPIHCTTESKVRVGNDLCQAATKADREIIAGMAHGGWITAGDVTVGEFLIATFGVRVPTTTPVRIMAADPPTFCQLPLDSSSFAGMAIVVQRGDCQFIDKAENAAKVGASMLIIVNTETSLSRFGVEPRHRGLSVGLPIVMVTDIAGPKLVEIARNQSTVKMALSTSVSKDTWDEIRAFTSGEVWTRSEVQNRDIFSSAMEKFAGWPERLSAIELSYKNKSR